MRHWHVDGTLPPPLEDWHLVFGSNLLGIHGAGAAKVAAMQFCAVAGVGCGPTGRAWAIPTKATPQSGGLPLESIKRGVDTFLLHARANPETRYWVTAVGTGLDGHPSAVVAQWFRAAPRNCSLPEHWHSCEDYRMPASDRMHDHCGLCWAVLR